MNLEFVGVSEADKEDTNKIVVEAAKLLCIELTHD